MSHAAKPVVITCALTGVLTDPGQHRVPVTAAEMAAACAEARDAGATVVHCHYRQQAPGMGRFPTWDPEVVAEIDAAIMHLYGLERDEVEHVLDSFPVLRKYEERDFGEFRTKRLTLELYDRMAEAASD